FLTCSIRRRLPMPMSWRTSAQISASPYGRIARLRFLWRQGNRISKQGQELGEICVVPSGAFEFAAKGSFGGILLHHVQRHVSQHREVVWPVAQSAPVLILVHDDIEPPV